MSKQPYEKFGQQLKQIRQRAKESKDELSGAVELDINQLDEIEAGKSQPSEDIVLMLISHFALNDDEALKMWELAGYHGGGIEAEQSSLSAQSAFVSPADVKILYTDMVHINANKYGVVMDFLQGLGGHNQPIAISRIGMSREHALSLLKVLQKTLQATNNPQKTDKETKK